MIGLGRERGHRHPRIELHAPGSGHVTQLPTAHLTRRKQIGRLLRKLPVVALLALSVSTLVSTVAGAFSTFGQAGWVIGVIGAAVFAGLGSIELLMHTPLPIRRYLPQSQQKAIAIALQQARRGDPLVKLFNRLWSEADDFLDPAPDLHFYENWLRGAAAQIGEFSPALAAEWSAPDPARTRAQEPVAAEVIEQRLGRIEALHRRVAEDGVPLPELVSAGFPGAETALLSGAL
jgi:hypothetical protein